MKKGFVIILSLVLTTLLVTTAMASVTQYAATEAVSDNERALFLFDKNLNTKWCVNTPGVQTYSVRYSEEEPVSATGLYIATGNDSGTFTGRNPEYITIYGSNAEVLPEEGVDDWKVILNRTALSLPDADSALFIYIWGVYTAEYQHYWVKMEKENGECMQISEFGFLTDNLDPEFLNIQHVGGIYLDDTDALVGVILGEAQERTDEEEIQAEINVEEIKTTETEIPLEQNDESDVMNTTEPEEKLPELIPADGFGE